MRIILRSQSKEPSSDLIYDLSWRIKFKDEEIQSGWTPDLSPSISETVKNRDDAEFLYILGREGCVESTLAEIPYEEVNKFGYIAEKLTSAKRAYVIGMWIELKSQETINVYRNGHVKGIKK